MKTPPKTPTSLSEKIITPNEICDKCWNAKSFCKCKKFEPSGYTIDKPMNLLKKKDVRDAVLELKKEIEGTNETIKVLSLDADNYEQCRNELLDFNLKIIDEIFGSDLSEGSK